MEIKNYFAQDAQGNIMPSANCYLYLPGTTTLATGLVDGNGVPISNPFLASSIGQVTFGAPNGVYDLRIAQGARDTTVEIQCADLLQALNETASFLGAHSTPPTSGNSGEPLQIYYRYFNTVDQLEYLYKSTGWIANNLDGQLLATTRGASLLGAVMQDGSPGTIQQAIIDGDAKLRRELLDPSVGGRIQAFQQPGSGAAVRDTFSKLKEIISVDDFKLTTDPDDSAAFMRVIAYVATKSRPDPYGVFSNLLNGYKIVLQPRDYLITTPSALSLPFSGRSVGVVFEGNGFARVFYQPTSPAPLFVNADKVLFLRVRGIIFTGASADSDFFDSQSTGGAQDYTFSDCYFNGVWRYGVNRTGTNTNSETRYNSCNWTGTWKAWEFIAATGTSDQFVNYWFNQCKYWSGSVWVDYSKGGHIRIVSCDISGYRPAQLPEGEGPGGNRTQYLLNLRGNTHGFGVCSLAVLGGRIEQGSEWAGLLNCEWGQGDVTFESFDSSSQTFNAFAPNIKSVYFSPGNNFGPTIKFSQSQLIGTHTFVSQVTTVGSKRAVYENSTFTTVDYPDDAFTFVDAGSQAGRRCVVRLKNCRGRSATLGVFSDADLNWNVANVGHTSQKGISLKSPTGTLPSFAQGSIQVVLPVNCVVVKVVIHVPSGASTSGNTASFTVQNGSGEVLATLNLAPISAGGTARVDLASICNTRERSTISLVPSALMNAAIGSGAFCMVEYL